VHLHVTLLTTTRAAPQPAFFGLPEGASMPTTILTTGTGARPPAFQSITWHGETAPGSGEHVVKIFSRAAVPDATLRALLGEEPGWLLRKEWDSYPVLAPTQSFAPVEPVRGVQYLAAMEPWVSTCVRLLRRHVWGSADGAAGWRRRRLRRGRRSRGSCRSGGASGSVSAGAAQTRGTGRARLDGVSQVDHAQGRGFRSCIVSVFVVLLRLFKRSVDLRDRLFEI
jgi:hypothetical protein